ncbi:hypothetical protein BGZ59_003977 [Podila verticillata]|nr:hypothetical protein BGZ59_003977 [Podila verticillata]KFH71488.1 hypothetical protein MVEG_01787 [Podila verticillata NRRL 6337]
MNRDGPMQMHNPRQGPGMPPRPMNPGFNLPLRPIPPHLQRPPFEQPMLHPTSTNPLQDLVDSEREYLNDLKILLQRVSAGWTQDDFPPKEVDTMLQNIENIHMINRELWKRLDELQDSPEPSQGLGKALMWFVDVMEAPYSNYCRDHEPHLDNWPEIINNSRLQNILTEIAAEQVQHVTLDSFLMKPIDRLHYYRRLYMRLLDSTERGNPDFNALEAAFIRIDTILRLVTIDVPGTSRHPASPALSGISSMSALRNALPSPPITGHDPKSPGFPPQGRRPDYPISPALPPSPLSPGMGPNNGPQQPHWLAAMQDMERTLDTSKVLDLFTMQPKACSLSLALIERYEIIRGNFSFSISTDGGPEDRFDDGHVLLLSDLLLMCRLKTREEMDQNPEGNFSSFWLLFPPLAMRHVFANDITQDARDPTLELTIVGRVKARVHIPEDALKFRWIDEVNKAQHIDSSKAQPPQGLNRNMTQTRPMMRPMSPLSPTFGNVGPGPLSPGFQGQGPPGAPGMMQHRPPMQAMGGRPPMNMNMNGMPSPGFRPNGPGSPMGGPMGGPMGNPMGRPGMMHHQSMNGRGRPMNRAMSMRRANTTGGRPGAPRGRVLGQGDVGAAKEVMFKTKPCDVFQWRDDLWDPLVEDDDCYVELRITTANRVAMAVETFEGGQLVLNAWIVESTTFRRASETDISVSMDMGASVQWFLVALNNIREADDFCIAFQRTKERAMYDPSLQKSTASPVLSRGDSLASTVIQQAVKREKPVKQTLSSMYPPAECKLFLQGGDHGHWMSLGNARVEIKMEQPSGHVRLFVGLGAKKRVLDSVIVQCDCLELVGPKKLAITLMNPAEKMSIIYMLQFKDELITTKIFEALSLNENE